VEDPSPSAQDDKLLDLFCSDVNPFTMDYLVIFIFVTGQMTMMVDFRYYKGSFH